MKMTARSIFLPVTLLILGWMYKPLVADWLIYKSREVNNQENAIMRYEIVHGEDDQKRIFRIDRKTGETWLYNTMIVRQGSNKIMAHGWTATGPFVDSLQGIKNDEGKVFVDDAPSSQ